MPLQTGPEAHAAFCTRCGRRLKCDSTRAETIFRISAKRTSPFKSAGASVQSTTGSRGVRISGSNAGYTMFRGSVKCTGYSFHSPVSPSLPVLCVTVCHHISTGLYRSLSRVKRSGHGADLPPASSAQLVNGRSYTSAFLSTSVGMSWCDPDHMVEAKRDERFDCVICVCVLSKDLNWTVSIPLCTCNKFIKLNRLYTTYK